MKLFRSVQIALLLAVSCTMSSCVLPLVAVVAIAAAAATVAIVASHDASVNQRQVAVATAQRVISKAPESRKVEYKKKRYIAVKTVRDQNSKGKASVMVYDTATEQIV